MQEESIYNIIQENPEEPKRKLIYKSKYPHNVIPTGSTFGTHTTSLPGVYNLAGHFKLGLQAHTSNAEAQTFGYIKGIRKSLPSCYKKRRYETLGNIEVPETHRFSYDCSFKKEEVPRTCSKPIKNRKFNKDYVTSNMIENILSVCKKKEVPVIDWTKKKDFGKIPDYISKIKRTLSEDYEHIKTLESEKNETKKPLTNEEIEELREGLKAKWIEINYEYQKLTHIKVLDTIGLKRKKEGFEMQLISIEKDLKKLNRAYLFVE